MGKRKKSKEKKTSKKRVEIDYSRWPIDPKAVYSMTGEWKGWRHLLRNDTICDDCGNEVCACANRGAMHSMVVEIALEHDGMLTPKAVQELAETHEQLKLEIMLNNGNSSFTTAREALSTMEKLASSPFVSIEGVKLAYSVDELKEMGLV